MMKLVETYSRSVLKKKAAAITRKVRISPPDHVKKVGILWLESDIKAFTYIQEQFRSKSTIIRHLCYSDTVNSPDSNLLTKKDFTWLGFPKSGIAETFMEAEFDLLINLTIQPCYPLEIITVLSPASFKIGWDRDHTGNYDMTVDVSRQPDSLYLAEQMMIYLKRFTQNDEI